VLLLWSLPVFIGFAFSGYSAWLNTPYDAWRMIEVVIVSLFGMWTLFSRRPPTSFASSAAYGWTLWTLLLLLTASTALSTSPGRAATDAALYLLLAAFIYSQSQLYRRKPRQVEHIAALIAVAPMLMLILLSQCIIDQWHGLTVSSWHGGFSNIRMLDDALLPCLFLLWQRPIWLSRVFYTRAIAQFTISAAVYLLSSIYLLVFWLDGARAGFLSIAVGLIIVSLRRDYWHRLHLPLISLILAALGYAAIAHWVPSMVADTLFRSDSSLRNELWLKAFHLWQGHPLLGVGGDHYIISAPWMLNGHPHNIILQFMSEWGAATLLIIGLCIPLLLHTFFHFSALPIFIVAGVAAIFTDSLLSGIFVYPLSQVICSVLMAWLIAALPESRTATKAPLQMTTALWAYWQTPFKVMIMIAILSLANVHGRDYVCPGCESQDDDNAPRFWQHGRATHLTPVTPGTPAA